MKSESFFISLLTVLFIGLKLTGYIDWSWWWVLSPIWITAIIAIPAAILVIYLEKKKEIKEEKELLNRLSNGKKSKFQEKLEEAMKASEERRNSKN